MTIRAVLEPVARDEQSITVAAAADRLGCDRSTVYELLRKDLLAGIKVGKSDAPIGVRVKLWSIVAWEEKHAVGGTAGLEGQPATAARRRGSRGNPADREADAALKALGA